MGYSLMHFNMHFNINDHSHDYRVNVKVNWGHASGTCCLNGYLSLVLGMNLLPRDKR